MTQYQAAVNERRWPAVSIGSLLALMLLFLACSGGTSDEARRSWRATLQFTAEQWLNNSVPSSFVRTTCESARKILPREAEQLEQAVARNDRSAVVRLAESLKK
jgi:hypothetical protein